ncbi:putative SAM-dependent methyltransferase [Pseudomonas psychrotolerans]|nr:putative SAM-dependent methyltransferase [Pseudomonas psychrotolerans]
MALAVRFFDQQPAQIADSSLRDDVLRGFAQTPKALSPKYFYDQRGSELFEAITRQPEYYPTRTEEAILATAAGEIAQLAGRDAALVELGSGASPARSDCCSKPCDRWATWVSISPGNSCSAAPSAWPPTIPGWT